MDNLPSLNIPEEIPQDPHDHNGVNSARIDYNNLKNKPASTAGGTTAVFWGGQGLGGSGTAYFGPSIESTIESAVQIKCPIDGTVSDFNFTTYTSQAGDGSYTLTIRKNGADTSITVTVSAGAGAGFFSDITHSFTVAAGDKICIKGVNAGTSNAAYISAFSFKIVS